MPGTESNARVLSTGAVYFATTAVQRLGAFVTLPLVAGLVGPANYGRISLAVSLGLAATYAIPLGQDVLVLRALTATFEASTERRQLADSVRVMAGAALIGLLATAVISSVSVGLRLLVALELSSAVAVAAVTTVPLAVWRAHRESLKIARLLVAITFAQAAGRVGFTLWSDGALWGWALGSALGAVAAVLGTLGWYRQRKQDLADYPRRGMWDAVRQGVLFVPHQLASWGLSAADRLVLVGMVSSIALGVYSLAYQICAVLGTIFAEANRAMMPSYGRSVPEVRIAKLAQLQAAVTLGICGVSVIAVPYILGWILPSAFLGGVDLGYPFVLGMAGLGFYLIFANQITLRSEKPAHVSFATVCGLGVNVGINFAFVPHFGVIAAAWATAISYGTLMIIAGLMADRSVQAAVLPSAATGILLFGAAGAIAHSWPIAPAVAGGVAATTGSLLAILGTRPGRARGSQATPSSRENPEVVTE